MKRIIFLMLSLYSIMELGAQPVIPQVNHVFNPYAGRVASQKALRAKESINPQIKGSEAYRLVIRPEGTTIEASTRAGIFYGRQTLVQLCVQDSVDFMEINDAPRFEYRALMLDPARHFIPVADLKLYVDMMSRYKFNTLHLHLSDDQGFRVEVKAYPLLTKIGSVRRETEGDGRPHKGYYTQKDLRDLVAYAAARHVQIIPEIDIPGHSVAAITAYPYLTCRDTTLEVRTTPGVSHNLLCVGNERVFGMYDTIVSELCAIFPSDKFHLGGDEAPLDHWTTCAKCQTLKLSRGMTSNQELMSYFFDRINKVLKRHNKSPLFWFELDVPSYPEGSTMYAWRWGLSPATIQAARKGGYQIICAPGEYAYFDYPEARADISAPSGQWMPLIPLDKVYQFNPTYNLPPDQTDHVIGVEATIWGEYTPTVSDVFQRTFPRAFALAEVGWTQMHRRDKASFYERIAAQERYLDSRGVNYRKPIEK